MENFLMYMNQEIEPNQIVWVIRKNRNGEFYLDIGECIGFKVFKDRGKENKLIWKIGVESWLNDQKLYNKITDLNELVFFNGEDAINKIANNPHAIILHYNKSYTFKDGLEYKVIDVDKTKHGVIYTVSNNANKTFKLANKDVNDYLTEFIY